MTAKDSIWPEKLSGDRKRAIDELVRGRCFTNQLLTVLGNPVRDNDDHEMWAQDLLAKILRSFTDTLSILSSGESDEVASQIPASSQLYSPGWDGRKSEGSGESGKSSTKDRRGCYKRRWLTYYYPFIQGILVIFPMIHPVSACYCRINYKDDGILWFIASYALDSINCFLRFPCLIENFLINILLFVTEKLHNLG